MPMEGSNLASCRKLEECIRQCSSEKQKEKASYKCTGREYLQETGLCVKAERPHLQSGVPGQLVERPKCVATGTKVDKS